MSIRSSELDDERLGERYARRSAEEDDPFNPNGDANAARNSDEDSLFPSKNEEDGNGDDNNVNEESEGHAGFPQARDEIPQAIDTTTHHGHATRARTRIRLQGDETRARKKPGPVVDLMLCVVGDVSILFCEGWVRCCCDLQA